MNNKDVVMNIGLFLSVDNLYVLSQVNKQYNNILRDNYFWKMKYFHDYNKIDIKAVNWKFLYLSVGNVYVIGKYQDIINDKLTPINKKGYSLHCNDDYFMITNEQHKLCFYGLPPNFNYKSFSAGMSHIIAIDYDDVAWMYGQHYLTNHTNISKKNIPNTLICLNKKVKSVHCGSGHTFVIDFNNDIWAFGGNYYGQLGLYDNENRDEFTKLNLNIDIKTVVCGGWHTVIVDVNDHMWVFGNNDEGQLGLGIPLYVNKPILIDNIKVKSVACGAYHTVVLDFNNNIYVTGYNAFGQLGLGINNRNINQFAKLASGKYITCGDFTTCIIDMNNDVWGAGMNTYKQLGNQRITKNNKTTGINKLVKLNTKAKFVGCCDDYTVVIK